MTKLVLPPRGLCGWCFYLLTQLSFFQLYLRVSVKQSFSLFLSCLVPLPLICTLNEGHGERIFVKTPDFPNRAVFLLLISSAEIQTVPKFSHRSPHSPPPISLLGLLEQDSRLAGLNHRNVLSRSSGGWASKIKMSKVWFLPRLQGEAVAASVFSGHPWCSLACGRMTPISACIVTDSLPVCLSVSRVPSFARAPVLLDQGPLTFSLTSPYLMPLRPPCFQTRSYSVVLGVGLQHRDFGGTQFNPQHPKHHLGEV